MSKRQTVVFLLSALLLALLGILWGMASKAESALLGGSCNTSTPPPGMEHWNVPDCFGVEVSRAYCSTGLGCWRLVGVEYLPEEVSGGTHHIYITEPHDATVEMEVCVSTGDCYRVPLDKPQDEPAANFAMFAGARHRVQLVGAPSDEIFNLMMRGPTEETEHQAHHISFKLTWEWTREIGPHSLYLPLVQKP